MSETDTLGERWGVRNRHDPPRALIDPLPPLEQERKVSKTRGVVEREKKEIERDEEE